MPPPNLEFSGRDCERDAQSATNSLHGDVWEFFRNDILNSKSWSNNFNGTPKDKFALEHVRSTLRCPVPRTSSLFSSIPGSDLTTQVRRVVHDLHTAEKGRLQRAGAAGFNAERNLHVKLPATTYSSKILALPALDQWRAM